MKKPYKQKSESKINDMNADTITAICSLFVAVLALGITLWQLGVSRKHNRLSLTPHLVFDRKLMSEQPRVNIVLRNSGVGPAFVKAFSVFVYDKPVDLATPEDVHKVVQTLGIQAQDTAGGTVDNDGALAPNEIMPLFLVYTSEQPSDLLPKVHRLNMKLKYQSAYKEEFEAELNSDLKKGL